REPKRLFGHLLPRMWLSGVRSPIKRLRLMPEDVAHCALRTYETNRERVGLVVARRRHRQTYHDAGAHIEFPWRQHQQGMYVLHLPPDLRTAVDPDHVTATRTPGEAPSHQSSSAPTRCVAITSPPCSAGLNTASFCASVNFGLPAGLTSTPSSPTDSSTGWPTTNRADRATAAGMRTARLFPHRGTVRVALFAMGSYLLRQACRNKYIH